MAGIKGAEDSWSMGRVTMWFTSPSESEGELLVIPWIGINGDGPRTTVTGSQIPSTDVLCFTEIFSFFFL